MNLNLEFNRTEEFARATRSLASELGLSLRRTQRFISHEIAHFQTAEKHGYLPKYKLILENGLMRGVVYTGGGDARMNLASCLAPKILSPEDLRDAIKYRKILERGFQ